MSRRRPALWCIVGLVLAGCGGAGHEASRSRATPSSAAVPLTLTTPRAVQHATVLSNGRVLVTGGCTLPGCGGFGRGATSEIFDPAAMRFRVGPRMHFPRASNSATRLTDGRVLLAGGYPGEGRPPQATAEVFDPKDQTFSLVGPMAQRRADQTATLLPDGRVLIAGGTDGITTLDSTEYFDPTTNEFSPGPRLSSPRAAAAAVVIDGLVVVIGGTRDGRTATASTDVLENGRWVGGPRLRQERIKHAAVTLGSGRILVVGGATSTEGRRRLDSTELLDLPEGRSLRGPRLSEGEYKLDGAVGTLPGGRVVIAGGSRVDVYDPATNKITVLPDAPAPRRSFVTATVINHGEVLIAGGYDSSITPTDAARVVRIR